MIKTISNKIFKVFFALVFLSLLTGFVFLTIRNYILPEVRVTTPVKLNRLIKAQEFLGTVKPRLIIEVKATKTMRVLRMDVANNQIVNSQEDLMQFEVLKGAVANPAYEVKDKRYGITLDKDGIYRMGDRIYIEYVTPQTSINPGDTVLRYAPYNSNEDLCIEAILENKVYEGAIEATSEIYFWKNAEGKKETVQIESIRDFPDHKELVFPLKPEPKEDIQIMDRVNFATKTEKDYGCVVNKSAIVPIGSMTVGNSCYVYEVKTENSILGKTNYLDQLTFQIEEVGESEVALKSVPHGGDLSRESVIVNYPSFLLENQMKVRVLK